MFLVALIFRPGYKKHSEVSSEMEWVRELFDVSHSNYYLIQYLANSNYTIVGESAISFCLSVLTCVGVVFWIVYAGYGLSSLPIFLIKGTKSLEQAKNEVP